MALAGRYKIKTVAERSGFSATLLRAWERRYSFLLPERQASGHRLYTEDDMKVLRAVKLLLDRGQSIGEVSALGRDALLRFDLGPPGDRSEVERSALDSDLTEVGKSLVQAVHELDAERARKIVRERCEHSDFDALRRFARNVGQEVGRLWAAGKLSVASEHLMTSVWKECLRQHARATPGAAEVEEKTVICAGFPDELHELGLLFLNYELERAGHRVVYLGPALPFEDLESAVTRLQPHVVCLSVSRSPVLQVHLSRFSEAVRRHRSTVFVVGGAGTEGLEERLTQVGAVAWSSERPLREAAEKLFP